MVATGAEMNSHSDEHARTMAFAEIALGQIKALRQPASPRNFEIWYNYATGYNPLLNQVVNEVLASKGTLSDADIDEIYSSHIATTRFSDRIGSLNDKVMGEIEQIMSMIEVAAGAAGRHTESLADVKSQLGNAKDRDALRTIIESLVQTAKEMESNNQTLEARLNASKLEINQLQQNLELVRNESLTDPLTSLANRKGFDQMFAKAIADASERGEPLSLLLTDIDYFKSFNDTYGHLTGDQVLRLVAMSVKQNVKGQDIAARYGGEEFAVVLPSTALRQATTVGDHIRRAVMSKELMKRSTGEHLGRITISVGAAALRPGETMQGLIERADMCLYAAKRHGRNRVICETDPEFAPPKQPQVA
jgi:diguanylate cyclase